MNVQIEESWKARLQPEFEKDYFRTLTEFVRQEYAHGPVYPPGKLIFNAFNLCPFDKVKVVIIGQDPYHGPGQAHGLCFSVNDGIPFPPSLVNIFKEIKDDIGTDIPATGNLTRWAQQGVLLLNATLTVRAHQAGSHQTAVGKPLPMLSYACWPSSASIWCSSCGELMRSEKVPLSTVAGILCSLRRILLPFLLITAFSETTTSVRPMPICAGMARRKSCGNIKYLLWELLTAELLHAGCSVTASLFAALLHTALQRYCKLVCSDTATRLQ